MSLSCLNSPTVTLTAIQTATNSPARGREAERHHAGIFRRLGNAESGEGEGLRQGCKRKVEGETAKEEECSLKD